MVLRGYRYETKFRVPLVVLLSSTVLVGCTPTHVTKKQRKKIAYIQRWLSANEYDVVEGFDDDSVLFTGTTYKEAETFISVYMEEAIHQDAMDSAYGIGQD